MEAKLNELKSLLPEAMNLEKTHSTELEDDSTYNPDAIITYKGKSFCLVQLKHTSIVGDSFYIKRLKERMIKYCVNAQISYILVISKNSEYLFKAEDKYSDIFSMESLEKAVGILKKRISEIQMDAEDLGPTFLESLKRIFTDNKDLDIEIKSRLAKLTLSDCDWENISSTITTLTLSPKFEWVLFQALLGSYNNHEICRYTTRESLFRILSTEKQSLCSIVGMNDKSECNYVDSYFNKISGNDYNQSLSIDAAQNNYYISSCTKMDLFHRSKLEDNLSMWRMYADDCKGVCMVFTIDKDLMNCGEFVLAPISYAQWLCRFEPTSCTEDGDPIKEKVGYEKRHPELDFLYSLLHTRVGGYDICLSRLELWKHFFKDYEYKDENEVRLLYKGKEDEQKKWIQANNIFCPIIEKSIQKKQNQFPLILRKIILGPKFTEQQVNLIQIRQMVLESDIIGSSRIQCVPSEIDNYR